MKSQNLLDELSKIVNLDKIETAKNSINEANGLPNECYLNDKYFKIEREKVFFNNWTVVGVSSSVPDIGDAKPFNLMGIPLLILRDKNNKIRVFHNVCSHRGMILVNEECKLKNTIKCPYHSWSYNFNGELIATPHVGGMNIHETDGFIKSKSNLKEVSTYVWMDLIFINVNKNKKNFEESIDPLEKQWLKFISKEDQKLIRHAKDFGYFSIEVRSNWKLAIENYCESYHLPWVHPELNRVSNLKNHYHIEDLAESLSGQGSNKYSQQFDGNKKLSTFPNWPNDLYQNSEYISLFPNVMLGIHVDHFYAFWLEPLSNNNTREHFEMYYVGDESASSDEYKEIRKKNFAFWQEVMNEDVEVIEGMQKGRSSPIYNGGNFSPVMDTPTLMFHKWVATNLTK
jgi:choline monooxygenase